MKLPIRFTLLALALGTLGACSTIGRHAPVIERQASLVDNRISAAPPASVEETKEEPVGMYTVRKGDTLLRIALDHGQNYRDLVAWNNLTNPNDIKVDQVLRIAPAEHAGVQTSPVTMPPATAMAPTKKTTARADKRSATETAAEPAKADGARGEPKLAEKAEPGAAPGVALSAEDEKLSWIWPSDGNVVARFGEGKNKGIDIAGKPGQKVLAAGSGKVMYAGGAIPGYGNLVVVKHSSTLLSAYGHNRAIVVKEGETVSKGQMIAEMGDSDADAVKLHFEIRQQGKPVDPSRFLPNR
jgi:lipoprotein NlpD